MKQKEPIEELLVERKPYQIDGKVYFLWDDFDFDEKEWLDVVYSKLSGQGNEVSGSFTREEVLKTLSILLRNEDDSYIKDKSILRKTRQSQQVKILADFFLSKAIQGIIITNFSKISELKKNTQPTILKS